MAKPFPHLRKKKKKKLKNANQKTLQQPKKSKDCFHGNKQSNKVSQLKWGI